MRLVERRHPLEVRLQPGIAGRGRQGRDLPGLGAGLGGQELRRIGLELIESADRDHETSQHPRLGAGKVLGVVGQRGRHVEPGGREEAGVVDDARQ